MRNVSLDLNLLNSDSKIFPICVPSYNRPDAVLLNELSKNPKLPVILFIRREQELMYKKWEKYFKIVLLDNVKDIGETRNRIVQYAIKNNHDIIFMFDDDIYKLNYLVEGYTKKGNKKLMMKSIPEEECQIGKEAMQLWTKYIEMCENLALSGIIYRPFSWMWSNKKLKWEYNKPVAGLMQVISVNVKLLAENNISYKSNDIVFNEDKQIVFDCLVNGLNIIQFKEFTYSVKDRLSCTGGCLDNLYNIDQESSKQEKIEKIQSINNEGLELFMKNVIRDHPGVTMKKDKKGNNRISFHWENWKKPWKEVGE